MVLPLVEYRAIIAPRKRAKKAYNDDEQKASSNNEVLSTKDDSQLIYVRIGHALFGTIIYVKPFCHTYTIALYL